MISPTQRTLKECKRRGYVTQVVEHFNFYTKRRIDMFGCIDIVAIAPIDYYEPVQASRILGIQCTSGTNHAARRVKALAEPRIKAWLEAGGRFEIWSFSKRGARGKRKLWELRVEVIGVEDYEKEAM